MSSTPFRPMLAGKVELSGLRFPVLAGAKLDGIRSLAMDGRPMSRAMKPIRNRFVQQWFADHAAILQGLDGELIVGAPTDPDVYRRTDSAVMRETGEPDFTFFVFDRFDSAQPYLARAVTFPTNVPDRLAILETELITSLSELEAFEQRMLALGYEGVMLRDPQGPYKQGRSTTREGYLLKLKRFEDAEAVIVGFEEEMFNGNIATTNELGRTRRSSHQVNMVGKGTLGAFVVKGLTAFAGSEFRIGTGMTAAVRAAVWRDREALNGKIVKFTYFAVGVKDLPRHPVWKGFRDPIDL